MFRTILLAGFASFLMLAIEPSAKAGSPTGFRMHTDVVAAESIDTYTVQFCAGRQAKAVLIGDGDTRLEIYVYDANGFLITCDTSHYLGGYVEWTPKWTGTFYIKVVNRGSICNRYDLAHN